MTEAGLLERQHLQEWVLAHPQILGEDLLVITFEFDRWMTSAGAATWERLDVLAVDREGRLVVAELKRDRAPDAVLVQALNYAAMASRFNLDLLTEVYVGRGTGEAADPLGVLQEWAPALTDETLGPPRIVLVAEDFGPVLTNTAMFLIEQGLDLRLMRVQLFDVEGTLALTTTQVLPVPEAAEFMVRPRSAAPTQRATREAASRRSSIPHRLIAAAALPDGAPLRIVVPQGVAEDRKTVADWLAAAPDRAAARWRLDPLEPVQWAVDNGRWNLTTLIRHIVEQATGEPPRTSVWGPNWFQTEDGTVLHKLRMSLTLRSDDDSTGAGYTTYSRGCLPGGGRPTATSRPRSGRQPNPLASTPRRARSARTPGVCSARMAALGRTSGGVIPTTRGARSRCFVMRGCSS